PGCLAWPRCRRWSRGCRRYCPRGCRCAAMRCRCAACRGAAPGASTSVVADRPGFRNRWPPAGLRGRREAPGGEPRPPTVSAVSRSPGHTLSKPNDAGIRLLAGLGVEGDAHMGVTVKHRSRVAKDPTQPNLRQVHLIHAELHDELAASGFRVAPGVMG